MATKLLCGAGRFPIEAIHPCHPGGNGKLFVLTGSSKAKRLSYARTRDSTDDFSV